MRGHAESASIAFARFLHEKVYVEIQESDAGGGADRGAAAPVGPGGMWDPRYSADMRRLGKIVCRIISKVLKQALFSSLTTAKNSDFLLNAWMYGTICAALIAGAMKKLKELSRHLHPNDFEIVVMIASALLVVLIIVLLVFRERVHSTCCNVRSALFAAVCFVYEKLLEGAGEAYEEWKAQGKAHKD
jgi:hypothetical protein